MDVILEPEKTYDKETRKKLLDTFTQQKGQYMVRVLREY